MVRYLNVKLKLHSTHRMELPSGSSRCFYDHRHQLPLRAQSHARCFLRHRGEELRCAQTNVSRQRFRRLWKRATARSAPKGAESTFQEMASLDKLIDLMLSARSPEELGKTVAKNLLAFDQKFWLRLATRNDSASTAEEKKRLQDLAGVTMRLVDALVKKSDSQLTDSAAVLEKILVAAADENGQWQVPLSDAKVEAMRKEMEAHTVDESLLANAFAWMRKAKEDKLEDTEISPNDAFQAEAKQNPALAGTVVLLQTALQLYSAKALVSPTPPELNEDRVLEEILGSKDAEWLPRIQASSEAGRISESSFLTAIRRKMETVVLALPSGSYAQRVQAEYLKELETRAEVFFKG